MFLEERMNEQFSFGSSISEMYDVDIVETSNGNEYRTLRHPYPKLLIDLQFTNKTESWFYDYIADLYKRSGGMFGGFRFKNPSDYSSNDFNGTPTYNDQAAVFVSDGVYQVSRWYGTEGGSDASYRRVKKLVSGSLLVGIRDDNDDPNQLTLGSLSPDLWTADYNSGLITFAPNISRTITGITQAAQAEITVGSGHGFVAGRSVHISGVAGMTQINGKRAAIQSVTSTTIVVNINSSGYSAFSSSSPLGQVNTRPQENETVTCGYQFDIPVRFATDLSTSYNTRNTTDVIISSGIQLIEIFNP